MALTFANMQSEVANQLRLDTADSNILTLIKRWINLTIQEVHSRSDWWWDQDREIVQTVIDKTAGTVDVSAGGTTVTGTSTAFASADVGKYIQFSSSDDWYKITAVASTTSLTIESAYLGTAALDDGTYTIRQFYYGCSSSVEKVLSVTQSVTRQKLKVIHFKDFDHSLLFQDGSGDAFLMAVWGRDSSGNVQFAVYPYPDTALNLELKFKKTQADLSADDDEPRIPNNWRWVILTGTLKRGLEYSRTDHNDRRAEGKGREFEDALKMMLGDAHQTDDYHPVLQSRETRGAFADIPMLPPQYDWRQ